MIQSFNGLTVILDGKFSFYSYIIIKKWKMRIFDILIITNSPKLQIPCVYHRLISAVGVAGDLQYPYSQPNYMDSHPD
jgi:hypothetical protein